MYRIYARPELQIRRLKMGLTAQELAAQLERTSSWWSRIENQHEPTSTKIAARTCEILEVGFDEIWEIREAD